MCNICLARGVSVTGNIIDGSTKTRYFGVQRFRNFGSKVEAHHEMVGNFAPEGRTRLATWPGLQLLMISFVPCGTPNSFRTEVGDVRMRVYKYKCCATTTALLYVREDYVLRGHFESKAGTHGYETGVKIAKSWVIYIYRN